MAPRARPVPAPDLARVRSAHLVGIGGTAMTPLATILLQMGVRVSGSDLADPPWLQNLRSMGASVFLGHRAEQVGDVDLVVMSSAVPAENVEVVAARARGIPVVKHSAALGKLMAGRRGVAVAGTHGKTTTAALAAFVLDGAGLAPTFHVGSELVDYGLFGRYGLGDLLVAEADEFDRRFLDYDPEIAVVTSVEPDHLDYFGTFEELVSAFEAFVARVRPGGAVFLCADDPVSRDLACPQASRITYGYAPTADWRVVGWRPVSPSASGFSLQAPDGAIHTFQMRLLGRHNAANAAAAVALSTHLGVPMEAVQQGLLSFRGTRRRFEIVGVEGGVTVVDDYAHHPSAIRATLAAARAHFSAPIWAVFQPHTAHRTASLFDEFARSFAHADHVMVAPTYRPAGRETEADDPTVRELVAAMPHPDARAMPAEDAAARLTGCVQRGDLVVVMGAGDIWTIEERILAGLRERAVSRKL